MSLDSIIIRKQRKQSPFFLKLITRQMYGYILIFVKKYQIHNYIINYHATENDAVN